MSRSSDLGALGGWSSSLGADAAPGLSPGQVVKVTPALQNTLMTHIMGLPPDAVHLGASLDDYREYAARQEQQQRHERLVQARREAMQQAAQQQTAQSQQLMRHGLLRYPTTTTGNANTTQFIFDAAKIHSPSVPETPERWLRRRVAEVQWRPA